MEERLEEIYETYCYRGSRCNYPTLKDGKEMLSSFMAALDASFGIYAARFKRDRPYSMLVWLKDYPEKIRVRIASKNLRLFGNGFTHIRYFRYIADINISGGTIKYLHYMKRPSADQATYQYDAASDVPVCMDNKRAMVAETVSDAASIDYPKLIVQEYRYLEPPPYPQNVRSYICDTDRLEEVLTFHPKRLTVRGQLVDTQFDLLAVATVQYLTIANDHPAAQLSKLLDNPRIRNLVVICSATQEFDLSHNTTLVSFMCKDSAICAYKVKHYTGAAWRNC